MSALLVKRLARSLWRSKLRLFAVVALIALGIMAGISFGSYAKSATSLYDTIYEDNEEGINLPDLWVENSASTWNATESAALCERIRKEWPDANMPLHDCEPRLQLDGLLFHTDKEGQEQLVVGVWHGIDEGRVHRVWMPEHESVEGRLAQTDQEIVIDAHAASGMDIALGDTLRLGAGRGRHDFTVVGIGYHAEHLYFAQKGAILPATPGTLITGYMTDAGAERLAALEGGSSNVLLLDVEGSPEYDLQSTTETEGAALAAVVKHLSGSLGEDAESPVRVFDRSSVQSVEFLRADAEGAMLSYPYITGMLAIVAGITIFLSLQRLIQSQAREIAILRTLGVGRWVLMPAYILAPLLIGVIGAAIGVGLGIGVGAPAMRDMYETIIGVPVVVDGLDGGLVQQNVIIAMVIVFLSGIRPAWQASKLQPLEILRGQHEVRLSSRRIQRWTSRLPATIGLTVRSSIRKPVRLFFTFIGVGLSMLIFGSMLLMMGSMEDLALGGFEDKESWDAQVQVPPGGETAVVEWAESKGASSEVLLQFPSRPAGDPRQLMANGRSQLSTESGSSMSLIALKDGVLPTEGAQPPQVVIDEGSAHFLDWKTGETRTIMFGPVPQDIEISGISRDEMARSVHFHRSDLTQVIGLEATSVFLSLPEGVEVDDALGDLSSGIILRQDTIDTFTTLMDQQKQFFNAILFLGILIAVVVLFNTLLMNLAERDTELATLRVLGAPIRSLGWMLFLEHLAIGLVGGILGCIFSIVGTTALVDASAQWAFYFTVEIQWGVLLLLVGIVVGIAVLLTPLGMRRIRKMDLVEKVKAFSS